MPDLYNDIAECMMDEVMCDMADSFFERRRKIDMMNDVLQEFIEGCRRKEHDIVKQAAFLHYLLVDQNAVNAFYTLLGINLPTPLNKIESSPDRPFDQNPKALTLKNKYVRLVLLTYEMLQQSCHEYLHGKYPAGTEPDEDAPVVASCDLVKKVCDIINELVSRVNKELTPSAVMRTFRSFDVETAGKMSFTGSHFENRDASLREKLDYKPVRFDDLNLTAYPDLPDYRSTEKTITTFCKQHYGRHKARIKQILDDIGNHRHSHPN